MPLLLLTVYTALLILHVGFLFFLVFFLVTCVSFHDWCMMMSLVFLLQSQ